MITFVLKTNVFIAKSAVVRLGEFHIIVAFYKLQIRIYGLQFYNVKIGNEKVEGILSISCTTSMFLKINLSSEVATIF